MKSLLAALLSLFLILTFSIYSAFRISALTNDLTAAASSLPAELSAETFDSEAAALLLLWQEQRNFIRYTVGHEDSEAVDDALSELIVRYHAGDRPGYLSARERFISLLTEIRDAEQLSFYGII